MPEFMIGDQFSKVQVAIDGRAFTFDDGLLTVSDADAESVRKISAFYPYLELVELTDGESEEPAAETQQDPPVETVEPAADPTPEATPTADVAETAQVEDVADAAPAPEKPASRRRARPTA